VKPAHTEFRCSVLERSLLPTPPSGSRSARPQCGKRQPCNDQS
jgi:hypothetical protein